MIDREVFSLENIYDNAWPLVIERNDISGHDLPDHILVRLADIDSGNDVQARVIPTEEDELDNAPGEFQDQVVDVFRECRFASEREIIAGRPLPNQGEGDRLTEETENVPGAAITEYQAEYPNGNYPGEQAFSKPVSRKQLEKQLQQLEEYYQQEKQKIEDKLNYMNEVEADEMDELDYKVARTLELVDKKPGITNKEKRTHIKNLIQQV